MDVPDAVAGLYFLAGALDTVARIECPNIREKIGHQYTVTNQVIQLMEVLRDVLRDDSPDTPEERRDALHAAFVVRLIGMGYGATGDVDAVYSACCFSECVNAISVCCDAGPGEANRIGATFMERHNGLPDRDTALPV